jgi:SAM-dependent methyltransferase
VTRLLDALRWSVPGLHLQAVLARWRRTRRWRHAASTAGQCAICERAARFVHASDNHREDPLCLGCGSVPRQRALVQTLHALRFELASAAVHEASPSLGSWLLLRRHCASFTASMWLPGVAAGARVAAFHHVDLQRQPFPAAAFDLVITQDVLEHVPDAVAAVREIHRTLRPGGAHVFTVPRRRDQRTQIRAEWRDGTLRHLLPPEFHADPSTRAGTLVVTDWGMDLEAVLADRAGAACVAHAVADPCGGIPSPVEVFVSRPSP